MDKKNQVMTCTLSEDCIATECNVRCSLILNYYFKHASSHRSSFAQNVSNKITNSMVLFSEKPIISVDLNYVPTENVFSAHKWAKNIPRTNYIAVNFNVQSLLWNCTLLFSPPRSNLYLYLYLSVCTTCTVLLHHNQWSMRIEHIILIYDRAPINMHTNYTAVLN